MKGEFLNVRQGHGCTRSDQKQIGTGEFIWYMVSVFFYTNMTGMVGQYRNNFLVDVVQINQHQAALFNTLVSVVPWVLNFVYCHVH